MAVGWSPSCVFISSLLGFSPPHEQNPMQTSRAVMNAFVAAFQLWYCVGGHVGWVGAWCIFWQFYLLQVLYDWEITALGDFIAIVTLVTSNNFPFSLAPISAYCHLSESTPKTQTGNIKMAMWSKWWIKPGFKVAANSLTKWTQDLNNCQSMKSVGYLSLLTKYF